MQTTDQFLGGKVLLTQEKEGLRATSDSVLLSAAIPNKRNCTLLDVGAGTGIIGLCAHTRNNYRITAIELQENLCHLITHNAHQNKIDIEVIRHNIFSKNDIIKGRLFDIVVTNPPFYDTTGQGRKNTEQRGAFVADFNLSDWLNYCLKHLKNKGFFITINKTENLGNILTVLEKKLGNIEVFPIQTKPNAPANRVIIRGILGNKSPLKLHPPILMHTKSGGRSKMAEKILRKGVTI